MLISVLLEQISALQKFALPTKQFLPLFDFEKVVKAFDDPIKNFPTKFIKANEKVKFGIFPKFQTIFASRKLVEMVFKKGQTFPIRHF